MSSTCVFPLGVSEAFRLARLCGFEGVEVMITDDPQTRDARLLRELGDRYGLPVVAVHAPVLLPTLLTWGGAIAKLERSAALAAELGAGIVVAHPPYRWQPALAREFPDAVRRLEGEHDVRIAVENMFPMPGFDAFAPSWNPVRTDVGAMTLDFSHAAAAGISALELAHEMGPRLAHVHLTDGITARRGGSLGDQHLIPGRGDQPVAETLEHLAQTAWRGVVSAEVRTRDARSEPEVRALLGETLRAARRALANGRARARAGG